MYILVPHSYFTITHSYYTITHLYYTRTTLVLCRLISECSQKCRDQDVLTADHRSRLLTELNSGGNIKYSVGTDSHPWVGPCKEIIAEMTDLDQLKVDVQNDCLLYCELTCTFGPYRQVPLYIRT